MPRIRTIKPEFFVNEGVSDLSFEARLAFIGLWTLADRQGRFAWRVKTIKVQVFPHDDLDFGKILQELADGGFIQQYEHEGKFYGVIPGFTTHQKLDKKNEGPSKLPPEPGFIPTDSQEQDEDTTSTSLGHDQGKERKGKERKGKEPPLSSFSGEKCSFEEAFAEVSCMGIPNPHSVARDFMDAMNRNGWTDKDGLPIRSWRALLRKWKVPEVSSPKQANVVEWGAPPPKKSLPIAEVYQDDEQIQAWRDVRGKFWKRTMGYLEGPFDEDSQIGG